MVYRVKGRTVAWGVALLILLLPLVVMQFTSELNWDVADFIIFGAMLAITFGVYDFVTRTVHSRAYLAAVSLMLATAFILIWLNLAAGVIGPEDDPLNLIYFGVLAIAIFGAIIARLRPTGMARTMFATAFAQLLLTAIALLSGLPEGSSLMVEIIVLNGLFAMAWLISAWLFLSAARAQP